MKFPEYVGFTLERLESFGYSAYLVGGCVRDYIMGITPHDFDITTCAAPEQIEECFSDIKTLDIGKKHGTITLVFGKECVEVTTYRIDGEYKDSRHPEKVMFTDRIEDDLARRDFTMNAIAYSPKHGFVDPFDGMGDIEKRRIVCVRNPKERFAEDALRILRALRFSARLGFEIEESTGIAIHQMKQLLSNIAAERINNELFESSGLVNEKYAADVLQGYSDVLEFLVPKLARIDLAALRRASNTCLSVKLCVLFSGFADYACLLPELKRLKFDSRTAKTVSAVLSFAKGYVERWSDKDIKRAVASIGEQYTRLVYMYLYSVYADERYNIALEKFYSFAEKNECMTVGALDIKGDEIIRICSIPPSNTGRVLSLLLDDVIEEIIPNTKTALIERAKFYAAKFKEI